MTSASQDLQIHEPKLSQPRGARPSEAREVSRLIAAALDELPFHGERFRAFEKSRYSEYYLRCLISIDPWHVCVTVMDKEITSVVVTVPDCGTLWAPWIYVKPAYRKSAAAASMIRQSLRHWDHGRFHKIACYVRPQNTAALIINRRFGFEKIADLEHHIFGEDFVMMERPLIKVTDSYDTGIRLPLSQRVLIKLAVLLRL